MIVSIPIREYSMILLGTLRLEKFVIQHADSRVPLTAWQLEAEASDWGGPEEVKALYADAEVQSDRVLFSFKDMYKLDVKAKFKEGILFVERVWTTKKSKINRNAVKSVHLGRKV